MFLLNVGGKWTLATEVEEVKGAVFLAAANGDVRFTRKASPELSRILIDPQLYLAGLDRTKCGKACGRLATHPWFQIPDLPQFDSGVGVRDWQKEVEKIAARSWPGRPPEGDAIESSCRSAVECQLGFGCTHVILPAPLVREREEEGTTLAAWLDAGLGVAAELEVGQPLLATVALSDATLNDDAFRAAGFLDSLVDHVTAREGLAGVYIVIAQTGVATHSSQLPELVRRAYLHLCKAFRSGGIEMVVVNFADVFGFVCSAIGATDVASGPSQSTRRLNLNAFRDDQYGVAVPQYYAHRVIGEFKTETDLSRLVEAKLLRRVADGTPYSEDLLEALREGRTAAELPPWAEGQNNLAAAQRHLVSRLAMEGAKFRKLTLAKRDTLVRDWLEDAEAGMLYLKKRLNTPVIGTAAPAASWLEQLDAELG